MNRRMIFYMLGRIMLITSAIFILPLAVSVIYQDSNWWAFASVGAGELLLGFLLNRFCKPKTTVIYTKEGFLTVALSWVVMSLTTAAAYMLTGDFANFADCIFESVSGYTTTGASVFSDVEVLSHGTQMLRAFSHWIGGMGVLVFVMAIVPTDSGRNIHMMRAEMPGPIVGKLVPKIKDTAKILYFIYIVMTATEAIFLLFGGMNVFEALFHSFGTAGTGGFSMYNTGIGGFSHYIQWVIAVFMFLFGINFNLYYMILVRQAKHALKSTELWVYIAIIVLATSAITVDTLGLYQNVSDGIRTSFFTTVSVTTTTGFTTTDFTAWPIFSRALIFVLLFVGGCAGSTAGGLKIARIIILAKSIRLDLKRMLHPRSVNAVKFEGKTVDGNKLEGVGSYFAIYIGIIAVSFLVLCLEESMTFEENLTASISCFNNVGPGFGRLISSYGDYNIFSKLVLSLAMLMGRLEIYPVLFALAYSTWTKKS